MKALRDCWRCDEAQEMGTLICPNCEAPNPCGHDSLASTVAERHPPKMIVTSNPGLPDDPRDSDQV